jgi:hypothetical protein
MALSHVCRQQLDPEFITAAEYVEGVVHVTPGHKQVSVQFSSRLHRILYLCCYSCCCHSNRARERLDTVVAWRSLNLPAFRKWLVILLSGQLRKFLWIVRSNRCGPLSKVPSVLPLSPLSRYQAFEMDWNGGQAHGVNANVDLMAWLVS